MAALSVLASTVALLYGGRLTGPSEVLQDSYDRDVLGHRALYEALQMLEVDVRRQRAAYQEQVEAPLLFIEPGGKRVSGAGLTVDIADVVRRRRDAGRPSIVVLPKWTYAERGGDAVIEAVDVGGVQEILDAVLLGARVKRDGEPDRPAAAHRKRGPLGEFVLHVPWLQTLETSPGAKVLLGSDDSAVVAASSCELVLVVSDPSLFQNVSFFRADHASLWWRLLSRAGVEGEVVIDEAFHGHLEGRSLGAALGTFPAVLLVMHGLLFGFVAVASGTSRFGRPLPPPPPFERGPKAVVRVTSQVLAVGQSPGLMAESYVEQVIDDISARLGLEQSWSVTRKAMEIDEVLRRRGQGAAARLLLDNANQAALHKPEQETAALRLARSAWLLRKSLLDSRRKAKADLSHDFKEGVSSR